MTSYDYDLITIGAGSGGVAASRYAASQGVRVAICESDRIGGTCVIRGCIPKKLFMYASQFSDAFADARSFGWQVEAPTFDMAQLTAMKNAEIDRLEGIYQRMLDGAGVTLLRGHARLLDAHTVLIGDRQLRAERILIATGGRPAQPAIPGIELAMTSDQILELTTLPSRLLVLGAGYIALEFAGIFNGLGSEVDVAFRADAPLRGFDADLRHRLAISMAERGVRMHPQFRFSRLERDGEQIVAYSDEGDSLRADVVLNGLGREPNTRDLGLVEADVELDADSGAVRVDPHSRTSLASVFAVGDVTNRVNLTPIAIAEARAFVDTEYGRMPRSINHDLVASAVFTQPPVASIGLSEEDALAAGHALQVFESDFRPMKNAACGRSERSYMKLVVDAGSDRVLGAHMIGSDAPEIIQSIAVAVTLGASKRQFDQTIAVHPSAAEEFVLMRTPRREV